MNSGPNMAHRLTMFSYEALCSAEMLLCKNGAVFNMLPISGGKQFHTICKHVPWMIYTSSNRSMLVPRVP